MKVLLMEDVYNLGRAGDVKKVANGYGRNFLLPQGLAVIATASALNQVDRIREEANQKRTVLNEELSSVAETLTDVQLLFAARAGETGKLYGSVTTQMIAAELTEKMSVNISKRQIDSQPLRLLGMHKIKVRLTLDLIPEVSVVVYREGEPPENYMIDAELLADEVVDEEELISEEDQPVDEIADTEKGEDDIEVVEIEDDEEVEEEDNQEE